jgi:hypothetical protein
MSVKGEDMKHLKMLGLAAVSAVASPLLLGGGTASAEMTELFGGATTLSSGSPVSATLSSGTSALLTPTSGELMQTCKGSTVSGATTNATGSAVSGAISTLSWSTCINTTNTLTNGSLSITKRANSDDGTVSGIGSRVTVLVFGFLDCVYGTGTGTHLGTLTGVTSGNATLAINAVLNLQEGSFGCPDTTMWVANYTVTTPAALNVGS